MQRSAIRDVQPVVAECPASVQLVMVVDDDPIIRMGLAAMIEDAGIDVIEAANANDAIILLEGRPHITLVFTDIEMPGSMDGLKLAFAVRGSWPPVTIIVSSGRVSPQASEMLENVTDEARVIETLRAAA